MRGSLVLVACILTVGLSGCASSGGTLHVQATDAPDNIGDFSSLTIEVSSIEIRNDNGTHSYDPATSSFDLVKLTNGNLTTLFKGQVPAGTYHKLELVISKASGVLKVGGDVAVQAPKGSIFLPITFKVEAGSQTDFVFDIHVVKQGVTGGYSLQPNAGGSHASK